MLFNPCLSGHLSAAVLAEGFYRPLFRRDASQEELVWISRISVVGLALLATRGLRSCPGRHGQAERSRNQSMNLARAVVGRSRLRHNLRSDRLGTKS